MSNLLVFEIDYYTYLAHPDLPDRILKSQRGSCKKLRIVRIVNIPEGVIIK